MWSVKSKVRSVECKVCSFDSSNGSEMHDIKVDWHRVYGPSSAGKAMSIKRRCGKLGLHKPQDSAASSAARSQ